MIYAIRKYLFESRTDRKSNFKIMLKTEELRIGNLVYFNDNMFPGKENQIVEIEKVNKNFVIDKTNKNSIIGEIENYKPIEINQEILLKLGLYKSLKYYNQFLLNKIKYVHRLQNIYFLLTNKELKTKL